MDNLEREGEQMLQNDMSGGNNSNNNQGNQGGGMMDNQQQQGGNNNQSSGGGGGFMGNLEKTGEDGMVDQGMVQCCVTSSSMPKPRHSVHPALDMPG